MDDIFKRIRMQLRNYYKCYGKEANAVFVGREEYNLIKISNDVFKLTSANIDNCSLSIEKVFGTRLYRVIEINHLSVGFIEEEVTPIEEGIIPDKINTYERERSL